MLTAKYLYQELLIDVVKIIRLSIYTFLVLILNTVLAQAQSLTLTGDSITPTEGMISSMWTHSWRVGQVLQSDVQVRGGIGQFQWTLGGTVPPGMRITVQGNRYERASISAILTQPGTFSVSITATDAATQQSVTAGPFDVVVGATVDAVGPFGGATVGIPYTTVVSVNGGTPLADCVTVSPPILDCVKSASATGNIWTLTGTLVSVGRVILDISIPTDAGIAFRQVAVTVNRPVTLSWAGTSTTYVFGPYTATVGVASGSGSEPFTFRVVSGTMPPGTILRSTPTFSPRADITGSPFSPGTYEYTVMATDVWGATGSITLGVVVSPNPPFTISSSTTPTGKVGQTYLYSIPRQNSQWLTTWRLTSGALPGGLALNPTEGFISGVPTQAGTSTFTVEAIETTSLPTTSRATFTIRIDSAPGPVIASPDVLPPATIGVPYNFTVPVAGGTPPYRWTNSGSLPPGLTLSTTGTISGTPASNYPYIFTLTVTDFAGLSYSRSFQMLVAPDVPVTVQAGKIGEQYSSGYLGRSIEPLSLSNWRASGTLPPGLYFLNGSLEGTPRAAGVFPFRFEAGPVGGGAYRDMAVQIDPSPGVHPYSVKQKSSSVFSSAGASGELSVSYGRLQPDRLVGTASFYQLTPSGAAFIAYRRDGVLVSETTVPASHVVTNGRVFVEITDVVNTGLAIANPTGGQTQISLTYVDFAGANVKTVSLVIPAGAQIAAFLNESPFNGPAPFTGTVAFNSFGPVGVIALRTMTNERGDTLLTTLPVMPVIPNGYKTGAVVIPQFAVGGGWTTQINLVNPSYFVMKGTIEFFTPGSASEVPESIAVYINEEPTTRFSYTVPAAGVQHLTVMLPGDSIRVGSVRITPLGTVSPDGNLTYSFRSNGVTLSETGLPFSPEGQSFRLFVENSSQSKVQAGISIANTSSSATTVELELVALQGTVVGRTSLTIPAAGQVARYLHEIRELQMPPEFQGVLVVSAPSSSIALSAVRGRYNERGDYFETSIPAVDNNASATSSEKIFSHLVDGAGYTSKVVIFSGAPALTGDGYLRTFSPSGIPLDVAP